ncbi:S-layer homology domain-containing protein [Cohnella fermenti]|uniref:S-layer homology domain-containing protein n=1 Tax=Cohnella fermenti TaxID=2565925 RepID=UPI001454C8DB|nr:S-layer homology domain-containing protein [Cohnella fermenti]
MKKTIASLLALLFILSPLSAYAASSLTLQLSATEVQRGGTILLSGTASGNGDIVVKIVNPKKAVFHIDVLTVSEGLYSAQVAIPSDEAAAPYGTYTVVAGDGTESATKTFAVVQNGGNPPVDPTDPVDPSNPVITTPDSSGKEIPSNSGTASGSVVQPALSEDGRYLVGSDTISKAIAQANAGSVTIELPESAVQAGTVLELPAEAIQALNGNSLDLVLTSNNRTIRLPAGAIPAASVEDGATIRLVIQAVYSDEVQALVNQSLAAAKDYKPTGVAIAVEIEWVSGDKTVGVHQLDKPAVVAIKLTNEQAKLISANLAGVYYIDGGAPQYVRGTLEGGTFTFRTAHFSLYSILEYAKTFSDLKGHWSENSVLGLAAKHIVSGVDDSRYEPNRSITRAEFAVMLMRTVDWTEQVDIPDASNPFKDVAADRYYTEQVAQASALGIVSGYEGAFRPNDRITREEAVVALLRAAKVIGRDVTSTAELGFADAGKISSWALEAVKAASSSGLIKGDGTQFHPGNPLSRAEIAVMIERLLPTGS